MAAAPSRYGIVGDHLDSVRFRVDIGVFCRLEIKDGSLSIDPSMNGEPAGNTQLRVESSNLKEMSLLTPSLHTLSGLTTVYERRDLWLRGLRR